MTTISIFHCGARYMHTVIADLCTGCELRIPPCPMRCIELEPSP
ncbi:hypothetical protein OK348_02740 [Flavobacterium sp. MXW15]|nr:hypothetical protein [Flavobacterium sp. MXW15]